MAVMLWWTDANISCTDTFRYASRECSRGFVYKSSADVALLTVYTSYKQVKTYPRFLRYLATGNGTVTLHTALHGYIQTFECHGVDDKKVVLVCVCGMLCAAYVVFLDRPWMCSYEVTCTKFSRYLIKEVLLSLWSSIFLGFGLLFLLLWVGIYV